MMIAGLNRILFFKLKQQKTGKKVKRLAVLPILN